MRNPLIFVLVPSVSGYFRITDNLCAKTQRHLKMVGAEGLEPPTYSV